MPPLAETLERRALDCKHEEVRAIVRVFPDNGSYVPVWLYCTACGQGTWDKSTVRH